MSEQPNALLVIRSHLLRSTGHSGIRLAQDAGNYRLDEGEGISPIAVASNDDCRLAQAVDGQCQETQSKQS